MDFDPSALARMVIDFCKVNPLPSAATALLLIFLVRRKPKHMLLLTLAILVIGYSAHLLSGLSDNAAAQQAKGFKKSLDIINEKDR